MYDIGLRHQIHVHTQVHMHVHVHVHDVSLLYDTHPALPCLCSIPLQFSLMWNLVPSKRGAFKATRTNFLFLFLMLAVLLGSFIPIGYAVARLHPSETCGPFR